MNVPSEPLVYADCFGPSLRAGITTTAFFPEAYAACTPDAYKDALVGRWAEAFGAPLALMTQTHGVGFVRAAAHAQPYPDADAQYTSAPGLYVGALVADCAGVVLSSNDASRPFCAVVHSGWKGTAQNIVGRVISAALSQAEGLTDAGFLSAWISPCARACCYRVEDDVAQLFLPRYAPWCTPESSNIQRGNAQPANVQPNAQQHTQPDRPRPRAKGYMLDIAGIIAEQLADAGIARSRIVVHPACSICTPQFHSHRRDGRAAGRSVVFAARL